MSDPPIPPIEYQPPYSLDFVSHLDAGCYPDEISPELLAAVNRDEEGRHLLQALAITQLELQVWKTPYNQHQRLHLRPARPTQMESE